MAGTEDGLTLEVIVPIGPGHDEIYARAVESVRIATQDKGPFEVVSVRAIDDTDGNYGRSAARNQGIEESKSDWLFFLDADDLMHPDALKTMRGMEGYDAVFGSIWELNAGVMSQRWQVPKIETYRELLSFDPYMTIQMGHFVRSSVARRLRFNDAMNTGEDWEYFLRLWKDYNCVKIDAPLMINDRSTHSTGPRSATGAQWRNVVGELVAAARAEVQGGSGVINKFGFLFPDSDNHFDCWTSEIGHLRDIEHLLKNRRVCIEGGAHVGIWTKRLAELFQSVYAFEPSPNNYPCLERNLAGVDNVKLFQCALGDKERRGRLHDPVDPGNSGAGWVVDGDDFSIVTIDSLNLDEVDFIKLDIEGMEPFAITGAAETIARCKPVVLVEQNSCTDRYDLPFAEAARRLESMGYRLVCQMNKNYVFEPIP